MQLYQAFQNLVFEKNWLDSGHCITEMYLKFDSGDNYAELALSKLLQYTE